MFGEYVQFFRKHIEHAVSVVSQPPPEQHPPLSPAELSTTQGEKYIWGGGAGSVTWKVKVYIYSEDINSWISREGISV